MIAATCPRHGTRLESVGFGLLACPVKNCSYGTPLTALEDANDKSKRTQIKEKVLEKCLQSEVVYHLIMLQYEVMETGKSRGKVDCGNCGHSAYATGWQGNTPGLPDLFIRGKHWPIGVWLAIELKGSETPVTPAQRALCDRGGSYICRSWEEVLREIQVKERRFEE